MSFRHLDLPRLVRGPRAAEVGPAPDRRSVESDRSQFHPDRGQLELDRGQLGPDRGQLPDRLWAVVQSLDRRPRGASLPQQMYKAPSFGAAKEDGA